MKYLTLLALINLISSCSGKVHSTPNPTAAWIPIGESKNGDIISIDNGTLSHADGKSKVWARIDYKKAQSLKQNATQFYASFNCRDRTFQTSRQVELATMGETIEDKAFNMEPKRVMPLSTEGIILQQLCWEKKQLNLSSSSD